MKNKWNQFWEWMFDRRESEREGGLSHHYSVRVKMMVLVVFGFIIISAIVMLAVWIDNYIKYHF